MQKLLTPLQYSSTLDELNEVRPLQVDDLVKQSVDIGVCNELTDGDKKAARGKLVKCTRHGAELVRRINSNINYELKEYPEQIVDGMVTHLFSQRIYGVLVYVYDLQEPVYSFAWTTPTRYPLQNLKSLGCYWCNFRGTKFLTHLNLGVGGSVSYNLYGMY